MIRAYIIGLAPVARAMLMAMGTRMVVAPTLDITSENTVASNGQHDLDGQVRHVAEQRQCLLGNPGGRPGRSMAMPSGIRLATRNTVFQLTDP